jgi:hypothetical protein
MELQQLLTQENIQTGATLTALIANKKIVEDLTLKLFGPTASYLGDSLKNTIQKQYENICKIFIIASKKLGDKINMEGGTNPRILRDIIQEGAFVDDEVVAEYFGGILASSKTEDAKDDSGIPYLNIIKSMSSQELLLHCLLYKAVHKEFSASGYRVGNPKNREKMQIFIPYFRLDKILINRYPHSNIANIIVNAMFRFSQIDLIDNSGWSLADPVEIEKQTGKKVNTHGLYFTPSAIGASLMMWGYGYGQKDRNNFFACDFSDSLYLPIIEGVIKLNDGG